MIATTPTEKGFHADSFALFLQSRDEPGWVADARRAAWERFQELAWPNRKEEEWIRTDIRLFKPDQFNFQMQREEAVTPNAPSQTSAASQKLASIPQLLREGVSLGGVVQALDSQTLGGSLDPRWSKAGVICCSLEEAVHRHEGLVRPILQRTTNTGLIDRFDALRGAAWSGGTFIYVPRNVVVDQPLYTLSGLRSGSADFGHVIVVLDEGAEASILSETASESLDATGMHCGAVDLQIGAGAKLRFVSLQNWGSGTWHFARQRANVKRDARLQWTIGALGGRLAKVNQHVKLTEPGAECQVNGALFTEDRQHFSYHTLQHHQAPHCKSDFLYKAALQDHSRTVWRGMIKVDKGAQKTDGYQRNDNLLLSANARADSIPGLEIEADDVRCTHGSTSGRVDDELIFYAQSRGFTRQEATRMIVTGFFQQVFDRITIDSVREALGGAIARRVREYE
jgi:Fe-S cluster assembly protein SufD